MQREDRKKRIDKIYKKIELLDQEASRLKKESADKEKLKSIQDTRAFIHDNSMRRPNKLIGWPSPLLRLTTTQKEEDKKRAREQAVVEKEQDLSLHDVFRIQELRLIIIDRLGPMELAMICATNKSLRDGVISSFPVLFESWVKRLEAPILEPIKQRFRTSILILREIKDQYANYPPSILAHLHAVFVCYRSYGPLHSLISHYPHEVVKLPINNAFVVVHDTKEQSFRPATEYGHFIATDYNGIMRERNASFRVKQGFPPPQDTHHYLRYNDYAAMKLEPINHHSPSDGNATTLVVVSEEEIISTDVAISRVLIYHCLVTEESLGTRMGFITHDVVPFLDLYECRREIAMATGSCRAIYHHGVANRSPMETQITKLNERLLNSALTK